MEQDAKKMIFISHSSKDKAYGQAIVDLLQRVGLTGRVFFSSDAETGIPVNKDIFRYLSEQIREDTYVLFLLSNNFYESIACLNEVGAVWGGRNTYALLTVPGFSINNKKVFQGALNPRKMAVKINDKNMIRQLVMDILDQYSIHTDNSVIQDACQDFIKTVQTIWEDPVTQTWNELWDVEQSLAGDIRNPRLYTKRGNLFLKLGEQYYQQATRDYLYAIFLDPDFFDAYSELIQAAAKRGDFKQAMWFAEEACRRFPAKGTAFGCRGYVKCQKGDYLEAIEDCERAMSLNENRWFYNTRGRCYRERGLLQEALVDFWTAHKIDPQYPHAIINIQHIVEKKIGISKLLEDVAKNKQEALANQRKDEHFDRALMYLECLEITAPSDEKILQEFGGLYYDFGQYENALKYWKRALEVNNSCRNNYLCATALKYQRNYALARGYYNIALEFPDCIYRQYAAKSLSEMDAELEAENKNNPD